VGRQTRRDGRSREGRTGGKEGVPEELLRLDTYLRNSVSKSPFVLG